MTDTGKSFLQDGKITPHIQVIGKLIHRYLEHQPSIQEADAMTGTKGWIICYIAENSDWDVYQRDFEEMLGISRSAASKLIHRMEHNDMICRESVPGDARFKKLVLTDRSWELYHKMLQDFERMENVVTDGFTEKEKKQMLSFLMRMESNLKK